MKKTNTKAAPVYTVDLSTVETFGDVYVAFVNAKVVAGEPIRPYELYMYIGSYQNDMFEPTIKELSETVRTVTEYWGHAADKIVEYIDTKNTPWYKKAWRKVTGLFHRK